MGVYEALGVQEKPSIYAEMENQKGSVKIKKTYLLIRKDTFSHHFVIALPYIFFRPLP